MLRSKATAALMKLKEIDRKYKIKSTEDQKVESSLSDISGIDSGDEISKHLASSGDESNAIIANMRPRLDIRMPEAHMERAVVQGNESELVTIFDKSKTQSPKSQEIISPRIIDGEIVTDDEKQDFDYAVEEENVSETLKITSSKNPSVTISEAREVANTETSISEDVPEAVSSSHPVSKHSEADVSREISVKSVESIIDADERVQSNLGEDPSTLVASGTYSDDFVETSSSEKAKESNIGPGKPVIIAKTEVSEPESPSLEVKHVTSTPQGYYRRSSELNKNTEPNSKDIVEPISVEVLYSNTNLETGLANQAGKVDHDVSEEAENLPHQKSSQSSSTRSGKERRISGRPHTSSSSRGSRSRELPSSFTQKDPETARASGTSSSPKNRVQSGSSSEKEAKNFQRVFSMDVQENQREAIVHGISWSSKDQVAVTRRGKMSSKRNKLEHTRAKDPTIEKAAPPNDSEENKTNKYPFAMEPVPSTAQVGPVQQYPKFLKDDVVCRSAQYTTKHRSIPQGQNKRRSNKRRIEDSPGSRHRTKKGSLRQWKKQSKEKPGVVYEARDPDRVKHRIKELRVQQERDELRSRVRGYVQQMMNEQLKFPAHDFGFRESIGQLDYSGTGSGQAESLRSFFKPLDLPNVAGFKRPDFEEDEASASADIDNKKQYLHLRMIRERVSGIRHWLKQQFVLYRDYSSLVSTINAKYIPVTLKDTKKMIHDMQKFYNGRERRHYER